MAKYKFTIISLFIILLAAIPLIILSNRHKSSQMQQNPTAIVPTSIPTPTVTPLTPQNADATFTKTDQQMQTSLSQMDQDLQSVNNIDTSQDNANGL